jgi:hypothetical protein
MARHGWLKLHRKFKENFLWKEPREYSRWEAWLDILSEANYLDKPMIFEGTALQIKRGQWLTSQLKLGKRWRWSRGKVERFMQTLIDNGMVTVHSVDRKASMITVCNFNALQGLRATDRTTDGQLTGHNIRRKEGKKERKKNDDFVMKKENPGMDRAPKQSQPRALSLDMAGIRIPEGIQLHPHEVEA